MLVFKFSNKTKTSFHLSCIVAVLMLNAACVRDSLFVTKVEPPPKPQVTESILFSEDAISSPYTQVGLSNARCDLQDADSFQMQFVDMLNQLRATEQFCGREKMPASFPLVWNTRLQMSAYEHSAQMAVTNLVSHVSLDLSAAVVN
ncbi:CAP domain-containing protein [Undibacterium sp.]|uniref:CAP domain-containing protein n=1 Tax=Undibacterium sp. TaxID=1914977 RepID=UPI0037521E74